MLASAKHLAGDGATEFGTGNAREKYTIDQGVDVTTFREFWRTPPRQYVPAVRRHHVGTVMPSYSSVDWKGDGLGNPVKMEWLPGSEGTGVVDPLFGAGRPAASPARMRDRLGT